MNILGKHNRKLRNKPVTVIIGIICKSSILLASDSQTTDGDSKRCDTEKIRAIQFGETKVLVAESGAIDTSSRILDVMEKLAANRTIESDETVVQTIQEAMHKVRSELRHQHFDCSSEELEKTIQSQDLNCSLMAAHYFPVESGKPFLHTVQFKSGMVRTCSKASYFESTGRGAPLANYLLSEFSTPKMDNRHAQAVAVYVVDKAIRHVAFCDRPIRLAMIYPWKPFTNDFQESIQPPGGDKNRMRLPENFFVDHVDLIPTSEVESIAAKVAQIDLDTRQARTEKLKRAIFSYADTLPTYPNLSKSAVEILKTEMDTNGAKHQAR